MLKHFNSSCQNHSILVLLQSSFPLFLYKPNYLQTKLIDFNQPRRQKYRSEFQDTNFEKDAKLYLEFCILQIAAKYTLRSKLAVSSSSKLPSG